MKLQRGFTLIELVIVIVILGILAVTAAPRFLDLTDDARQSALQGVLGAVNGAVQTGRAAYLIDNTVADIEGVETDFVNGYPDATNMCELIGLYTNDNDETTAGSDITSDNYECDTTTTAGTVLITDESAPTPEDCSIAYSESAAAGTEPTTTITTSGC